MYTIKKTELQKMIKDRCLDVMNGEIGIAYCLTLNGFDGTIRKWEIPGDEEWKEKTGEHTFFALCPHFGKTIEWYNDIYLNEKDWDIMEITFLYHHFTVLEE